MPSHEHTHLHTNTHIRTLSVFLVTDTGTNHIYIIHDMREYPVVSLKCNVIILTTIRVENELLYKISTHTQRYVKATTAYIHDQRRCKAKQNH